MKRKKIVNTYYACDFETTVYEGQTFTEVWSACLCELYTEDVKVLHSMDEFFDYIERLDNNPVCYFHNLKFDGSFILDYLLTKRGFAHAVRQKSDDELDVEWLKDNDMPNDSVKYIISSMGQWYTITIKVNGKIIEFRDSLKLLPFSLKRIGQAFKLKHQKLEMEYTGYRYAGCYISPEEEEYIKNDVLVLKEALEFMFGEGHTKLTIGACCMCEFKNILGQDDVQSWLPDLYSIPLDMVQYSAPTVGDYIRKAYRGGWCYLVKGKEGRHYNGTTADVNSLYPSVMSSESGCEYPIGRPTFWVGDIPPEAKMEHRYYFVRVRTTFKIKPNHLPFIQIKRNPYYIATECLESSDLINHKTGERFDHLITANGELITNQVEMTLTMTDWILIQEHYDLTNTEIIDGCWFYAMGGLFDDYIDKYRKIKMTSKGAMRELAKLFLNNLYGKMASSQDSSFKYAVIRDDNSLGFTVVEEANKKAGYIPIGCAITSYARNFTIRAAQKNYYGVNERGFIYADTDSIHCDLSPEEIKGIKVDDNAFCCWKLEACWDVGQFTRQKTYIEHVTHENLQPIDTPYYNVKCAGLPERSKKLLVMSITQDYTKEEFEKLNDEEKEFVKKPRDLDVFNRGLIVPSKLLPKRISGGIVLVPTDYEMR